MAKQMRQFSVTLCYDSGQIHFPECFVLEAGSNAFFLSDCFRRAETERGLSRKHIIEGETFSDASQYDIVFIFILLTRRQEIIASVRRNGREMDDKPRTTRQRLVNA